MIGLGLEFMALADLRNPPESSKHLNVVQGLEYVQKGSGVCYGLGFRA